MQNPKNIPFVIWSYQVVLFGKLIELFLIGRNPNDDIVVNR